MIIAGVKTDISGVLRWELKCFLDIDFSSFYSQYHPLNYANK